MATKASRIALAGSNISSTGEVDADLLDNIDSAAFLSLDGNGRLGIGTANALHDLHMYKDGVNADNILKIENDQANYGAVVVADANSNYANYQSVTPTASWVVGQRGLGAGKFEIIDSTSSTLRRLVIDNTGNVGIGTTNPLAKLSVGTGSLTDINLPIQISTSSDTGQAYLGVNRNGGYGALFGYDAGTLFKGVTIRNVLADGTTDADGISLVTNNNNVRMHVKGNGNVGIGTTSPSEKLQVLGNIQAANIYQNGAENAAGAFVMSQGTGTTRASVAMWPKDHGSYPGQIHIVSHSANASSDSGKIMFWDYNGSAWNANGAWDKDGNLGIGNTSPTAKLNVTGGQVSFGGAPLGGNMLTVRGFSGNSDPSIALIPHTTADARIDFCNSSGANKYYIGYDVSADDLKIANIRGFSTPSLTISTDGEFVKVGKYLQLSERATTISSLDANAPAGSLAYVTDGTGFIYYKGSSGWSSVSLPLGSAANPANNAQDIIASGGSVGDGLYWFKPTGYTGNAFQVYCDMTNYGGGWMVISKWYQDSPYTIDELYNANARNANTTYLLNGNQPTAKSTHSRLSRDQTNALWNSSNHISRIWTTNSGGSTASPYGTYFQSKITNTTNFDFWNAHYNSLAWSDQITNGSSYVQNPGTTYKVMRWETAGNVFTDSTFTDFNQPSVRNGLGWWDNITVNAPNYGNTQATRHMGFYGDVETGNQWMLTGNPSDSRFTSSDSDEGKRSIVYLK